MHHSIFKFSNVLALIRPCHFSFSMWLILNETTFKYLSWICKVICTFPMELTIYKISSVSTSFTFKFTLSCFFSFNKISFILYLIIVPVLSSLTMLLIFEPFAIIKTSLSVTKSSSAMSHSVFPLALIDISIWVSHSSQSIKFAIFWLSLILSSIRVFDCSYSSPLLFLFFLPSFTPLPLVSSAFSNVFEIIVPN